jgi:UDP-glucose 4-epimerase
MKVLVTGGAGFIGQHVVRYLRERGDEALIFDHKRRAHTPDVFLGDIRDSVAVTEAMAQVDGFVHLAAVLGTQETIKNPRPAAETNVIGGLNVLEGAAQYGLPGVYIGVGNHWMQNTYSISKTTVERFIAMFNRERGTSINIVRAMNAYGPGQVAASPYGTAKVRKITPSFICRALRGDDVEIYGDGSQISDMVYVGDVAEALVRALDAAKAGVVFDRAVEVGPSEHMTVREVAELVIKLTGSKSRIVCLPMRPGEIPGAVVSADVETLDLVEMHADSLVPVEHGMAETIEYFRPLMARSA